MEIKYLAVIESALNTTATFKVRSKRLMAIYVNQRENTFGLQIDSYVDERYDVLKSTEAACQVFKFFI